MTQAAFTPGPWEASTGSQADEYDGIAIVADRGSIAAAWPLDLLGRKHNAEANAHLIAAAPELYEALLDARRQLEEYEQERSGEDFNDPRINAALAKAQGL